MNSFLLLKNSLNSELHGIYSYHFYCISKIIDFDHFSRFGLRLAFLVHEVMSFILNLLHIVLGEFLDVFFCKFFQTLQALFCLA